MLWLSVLTGQARDKLIARADPLIRQPAQRCWTHKIWNVLDKVQKPGRDAVKPTIHGVMNAATRPKAQFVACRFADRRFADRWEGLYPKAVTCLRDDLNEGLSCFRYTTRMERKIVRTTNAIAPLTPSRDDFAKSVDGQCQWASSRTEPLWTVSRSPSPQIKAQTREPRLSSRSPGFLSQCHKPFDLIFGVSKLTKVMSPYYFQRSKKYGYSIPKKLGIMSVRLAVE
ncbi:MAG: hypothetical protein ACI9TH_004118 [Kiritimatiellia bacterium]|jgi:hypothetical protein